MELLLLLLVVCGLLITAADGNSPVVVKEDSDVVLPCSLSSKENIETKLFDWKKDGHKEVFLYNKRPMYDNNSEGQDKQFKGRVSHFGDELKNGNASIKISKTKVSDSGNYSCDFPHLQPPQKFNIQLVVSKCPKPHVTSLEDTQYWSLLQCEVSEASPKPKVEWKDSSGKILPAQETKETERGGSYDIILQTTVNKTDKYSCVVTQDQEDICHHSSANISIYIHVITEPEPPGIPYGWIVAVGVLVLVIVALVVAVCYFKNKRGGLTAVPQGEHENKQKPGDQETHPVLHEL